MDTRHNLRQLFADSQLMEEIQNELGSNKGKARLESAITDGSEANLDRLLSGDESAITGDELPLSQLEAIILSEGRPPLLIQDDKWEKPRLQIITQRLDQNKVALEKAIPKVGRIEIVGISPYLGTGWMLDEGIMITNRHVAEIFTDRMPGDFPALKRNASGKEYQVRIDFCKEHDRSRVWQANIKEIIFLEQAGNAWPDMALVCLDASGGNLPEPIALDDTTPQRGPGDKLDIAVIGYPARVLQHGADLFEMDEIFDSIYNVKRLSPGKITGVDAASKQLMHDCTTLPGNSGSPVYNLTTGKVCGLHYGGKYGKENYTVSVGWLKSRLAEINRRVSVVLPIPESVPATGYNPDFLGANVPLPEVPDSDLVAPVRGVDDRVLRYTHFSIVMHKERRLPFFTACNINGQLLYNIPRSPDRWQIDERIDEKHQIGEELYRNNLLDRGHLVRRLDPAWGETREEARRAAEETFFFTNCSPQHSDFNQKTWLGLEDYILGKAGTHDLKVSVFTGPVMADADPVYRGVQIPKEFWKVVVVRNSYTDQLSAAAYLISQAGYLDELEFVYGQFRTYQVLISSIEEKTGLSFGSLSRHDSMKYIEGIPFRVISGERDILI